MASHWALGLLFLGGGSLTLGTRHPLQLACLAVAAWPRWPLHPGDHQHHLQPLRHLYVLAAEPRSLKAIDADTGLAVFVPVTVTFANAALAPPRPGSGGNGNDPGAAPAAASASASASAAAEAAAAAAAGGGAVLNLVAPCLLAHDLRRVVSLEVTSPRYFNLKLRPQAFASHAAALQTLTLFVKRKPGHLSYAADPLGPRSVHAPDSAAATPLAAAAAVIGLAAQPNAVPEPHATSLAAAAVIAGTFASLHNGPEIMQGFFVEP